METSLLTANSFFPPEEWKYYVLVMFLVTVLYLSLPRYHQLPKSYHYMNLEQFKRRFINMESKVSVLSTVDMFHPCKNNDDVHIESPVDFLFVYEYVREFLPRANEFTNRPGPVCPFIPRSLKKKTAYFLVLEDDRFQREENLTDLVRMCRDDFLKRLLPNQGSKEDLVHKCLIIVIRSSNISHQMVDKVQTKLKPEFVIDFGLMLGEFYQTSNSFAKRNEDFYPLRTKVPLLVIRYLVADDIDFLNQKHKYPVDIRLKMVKKYIELYDAGLLYRSKTSHLKSAHRILEQLDEFS